MKSKSKLLADRLDEPITAKDYPKVDECVLDAIGLGPMTFGDLVIAGLGAYSCSVSGDPDKRVVIYWDNDESSRQTVRDSVARLRAAGHVQLVGRQYSLTPKGTRRLRALWRSRDRRGPKVNCPACGTFVPLSTIGLKEGDKWLGWVGKGERRWPVWGCEGSAPKPQRARRKKTGAIKRPRASRKGA